jgi:hypothetical protein
MKMRNDDLKKITEIKQYLLDPPVSFKLYDYALGYVQNAITVLIAYPNAANIVEYLQNTLQQLQSKTIPQEALRSTLIDAGKEISRLTSK